MHLGISLDTPNGNNERGHHIPTAGPSIKLTIQRGDKPNRLFPPGASRTVQGFVIIIIILSVFYISAESRSACNQMSVHHMIFREIGLCLGVRCQSGTDGTDRKRNSLIRYQTDVNDPD